MLRIIILGYLLRCRDGPKTYHKINLRTVSVNQAQDRQALLKAKYYAKAAPVASAGSNKVAPSSE